MSISTFMTEDHRACDHLLVEAENAAAAGRWEDAAKALARFRASLEEHLHMEEDVLFPALEANTGGPFGPTIVMRAEHAQMRQLLDGAAAGAASSSRGQFLGATDTLMTLLQQHNMKEERILYPMADRGVADPSGVLARMKALRPGA